MEGQFKTKNLSTQQIKILKLMELGLDEENAAAEIGIKINILKSEITCIKEKLNAHSISQTVIIAYKNKMI